MVTEYQQGTAFPGAVGRTADEWTPAWPAPARAKEGTPDALFFVLDDVGYGQLSTFGALIDAPNLDWVAANGLSQQ
jgi:arylsulfatase